VHTQTVLHFALKLLTKEKGDRCIIIPAVILHDVGWSRVPEHILPKAFGPAADRKFTMIHEEEGVKIARSILKKVMTNGSQIDEILQIISGHDTRESALSINDKIVKDSDKIARYDTGFGYMIKHFEITPDKLVAVLESEVEKWFFLPESKKMAKEELLRRRREIEEGN